MKRELLYKLVEKNDEIISKTYSYLKDNWLIIILMIAIALAGYGFELFNLNLTIDEEIASIQSSPSIWRIATGRWGMYYLNKLLFPFSVIPFVPLIITLIFHIGAILLIMESQDVRGSLERMVIGSLGISWPGMAYIYSFSTTNYGIGIGLFCVALSMFLFVKNNGKRKFWAVIPAAFAISIYEPLLPALMSVYLIYLISCWDRSDFKRYQTIFYTLIMIVIAAILYFAVQNMLQIVYGVMRSDYVENYFDITYLYTNFTWVITKLSYFVFYVYSGDETIYGIEIRTIGIILFVLGLSIVVNLLRSKMKIIDKLLLVILLTVFILLPFIGSLFTKGYVPLRSLVGLPIILSGWAVLGLKNQSSIYKSLVGLLAIFCVFQFISSSNHLFASSHLALQEDRILGSQLIERIEAEKADSNTEDIQYLEMIGYITRPSTPLISRIQNIGASFFGWDQGHSERVVLFLQTIGYYGLEPLPLGKRGLVVDIAGSMPLWPNSGSVKVIDDIVLVKFSPYSKKQILSICSLDENAQQLLEFCP
jgi:hypothetical protein